MKGRGSDVIDGTFIRALIQDTMRFLGRKSGLCTEAVQAGDDHRGEGKTARRIQASSRYSIREIDSTKRSENGWGGYEERREEDTSDGMRKSDDRVKLLR